MTNSSPQEPQNPSPDRKRRRLAGLTYDEIIAIIVAFSTIGAVLFWSWGSKIGKIAGNFGLGGQGSSLSGSDVGLGIGGINANSDLKFGDLKSDRDSLNMEDDTSAAKASLDGDADGKKFGIASKKNQASYKLDSNNKLAALGVGAAALPTLANKYNTNQNSNNGNINLGNSSQTPIVTAPDGVTTPDKPDSTTTAPDGVTTPDKPDSTATAPDGVTTPEKPDSTAITPDDVTTPDKPDSTATAPDGVSTPDKPDSTAIAPENIEMPDDVVPSYWAYPFVKQMSDQALVADFTETQDFEPDKLITRASMATLISQAFQEQPEVQGIKQFKDVTNDNAIAADVDQAVRIGFMQGYSDEEFRPLDNIPRYQVLVTLATGLGLKPSQDPTQILQKFGDGLDIPDWAKQQVAAAAEAGLIVNKPNIASNSLSPNESATRAEVAAMIHQALVKTGKLQPLESEYILNP